MIGHRLTNTAILDNVQKFWNLSQKFPQPHRPISCPVCREQAVIIKSYYFFKYPERGIPYRCDIGFKCLYCSAVWAHGIPITDKYYVQAGGNSGAGRRWTWREVLVDMAGGVDVEAYGEE